MASKTAGKQQPKDVDSLITCAICLDYFVDPRLLPCSHTYCRGCIHQIALANHGEFKCPMRDGTNIKRDHIDSLPINRAVRDMVEVLPHVMDVNEQNREPSLPECDDCQLTEANFWCIDCAISYCTTCSTTIHKRARTHHRRVPIAEKPIELKRCEQHRDEKLKYWCSCEKLICMDCQLSKQHKDHTAVPISEVILDITEKLKTEFKEAQTSLNQAITQGMPSIDINDNPNMKLITQTCDTLRKMIGNYEKALKNQELTIKQKTLSDHNGKFENILSTNDHTQLLETKKSLINYLEQLMKELKDLKQPIKTEYRIRGVDQLLTSTDNILKAARIVELKPKQIKWKQNGITCAGRNGKGDQLHQLSSPFGIFIDHRNNIFIADHGNHRIVERKYYSNQGQIIAGRNGQGNRNDQLNGPTNILVDKQNSSFIIADRGNRRVIRCFRENGTKQQILISDILCFGLSMDKNGFIYVSDEEKNEVRRWKEGDERGTIIAGGNGKGDRLNQLNCPSFIFVDKDDSLYVSDFFNHRVMKWRKNAKEGMVVAGGNGQGNSLKQLNQPLGVIVDRWGHIYVADGGNHRVMCWCEGDAEGEIVVGGNGQRKELNQLNFSTGLLFDNEENLYVVDNGNHRILKYEKCLN
ncbi:unnamed protein product [Adineta steineri]|uniref:Uncharacterized protein n=1 Tax=Adineta steineri TaxID=433720 RepID=A0A814TPF1_9BILA|nr:unnamed protein product [Adineta steineri]CAF4018906.1 unnamed protein product [Adineta steineri]